MSMQAWDAPNPNDNGAFNPTLDPSIAFGNTPTSSNFDFSMQNAQLQRMQNGNMRNGNGSPAGFQNPMYQTSSVIPSKRAHDFNESPRHASRSQTPQQAPYPGFTGAVNGQAQNPYQQHLHQNSSNATPSPIMQNQQFNPPGAGGVPARMQTASPSPYSPAGPNFAPQASPVQSDYGSRVDTPSNGGQPYMQTMPYANGMNANAQNFTPPPGNMAQNFPVNPTFNGNNMTPDQQRAFEMKRINMMRQLQADNAAAQQRHQMTSNPMMNNPNAAAMQQAAMRQQMNQRHMQQLDSIVRQPDQFASSVQQYQAMKNLPFVSQLNVGGRPINAASIFVTVVRHGGAKRVTMTNQWPQVALALHLHPSAAQEVAAYWHQNLQAYEAHFAQRQMQQRAQAQAVQGDASAMAGQMPPGRQPNYNQEQMAAMHARRASANFQTPTKGPNLGQQDPRQAQMNGFSPSHDPNQQNHAMTPQYLQGNQKAARAHQAEVAAATEKRKSAQSDRGAPAPSQIEIDPQVKANVTQERSDPIGDTFKPSVFPFLGLQAGQATSLEPHGGIVVQSPELIKVVLELDHLKPEVPDPSRYGNIDLHALIMGLKSGLPGEVKLALNLLSGLTSHFKHPSRGLPPLNECDDLLESLIDCAESQLEFLADNAPEVSDVMLISPYEELIRSYKADNLTLQDVPEFASLEYQLENAAQRLLSISIIVRNLSTDPYDSDKKAVAEPVVVKFMTTVIRYLGTRNNLLRTNKNALDFIKDAVVYMGNVAQYINFSGKEEALCILQFLLSFAPLPQPTVSDSHDLTFPVYEPISHRYVPYAIQTLAKLLARGDPNRTYLKSIFANDLASSPSLDLLTRSFGLCIAPLPQQVEQDNELMPMIRLRARFLAQGLLAADSLISFIPPTEHTIPHAWLASQDNFAHRLLRVIAMVGIRFPPNPAANPALRRGHMGHAMQDHDDGFDMISSYGVSILRKLSERAKDADHVNGFHVPSSEIWKKRVLLQALSEMRIDPRLLQQLSIYASLDD